MLDRFRRRAAAATEDFAGCRRVQCHVDGDVEWTIGHTDEHVLLAIEDAKPVELTAGEAIELAEAVLLRAAKLRPEAIPPGDGAAA